LLRQENRIALASRNEKTRPACEQL